MAERDQQVQGVLVEIFGEQYRIGGDPQQVQQVAAYVDAKMKEIAGDRGSRMAKGQVAMLAAMEITAELFKVMSERKVFTDRAHDSIERLTRLVEDRGRLTDVENDDDAATDRVRERVRQSVPVDSRTRESSVRLPNSTPVE
jgi:cell division protein ZapA (FtsZ GTPase activity inhibitor)